jgi:hypothetical protein
MLLYTKYIPRGVLLQFCLFYDFYNLLSVFFFGNETVLGGHYSSLFFLSTVLFVLRLLQSGLIFFFWNETVLGGHYSSLFFLSTVLSRYLSLVF